MQSTPDGARFVGFPPPTAMVVESSGSLAIAERLFFAVGRIESP